jgi:hypothetical protein
MPTESAVKLATEAYLFAFPLVFNLQQVERYVTTGVGANPAAPYNTFSHARTLATPKDTFVTINNDTVYSMAQIDLGVGPLRLSVPDTAGRYYVLQFVDAWTDNFAYVGRRATGTGAGEFLLVPPGWQGDSDGARVIRFPTRIGSIVGRWACAGGDDLPAVHALQDATTLTQVDQTLAPASGLPVPAASDSEALAFFERYRAWSRALPPAERDRPMAASFAALGLTGTTPVPELPDEQRATLEAGFAAGRASLDALQHSGNSPEVNGWKLTLHVFDYNLDFFEVGTIDSEEWKIRDPEVRLVERAASAAGGLWGNHGYEAAYVMTYVDADGAPLNGEHTYRLTLSPTPPVGGFWSLTMYDVPNFFLVENAVDRYSIGDRTPGTVSDADGGLTITISADEPADPKARANWLPAPRGDFRPVLRMYVPEPSVFDGSYRIPAIERV